MKLIHSALKHYKNYLKNTTTTITTTKNRNDKNDIILAQFDVPQL